MSGALTSFGRGRGGGDEGHLWPAPARAFSLSLQCAPSRLLSCFFPAPTQQGASLPAFRSFHQTHFFWWPSFPGTDEAHTCPGCFAWRPARGWHTTPVTSLSPPPHTRQRGGGSSKAGVTAGYQPVGPVPRPQPQALVPPQASGRSPRTSVSLAERLIPFSQSSWGKSRKWPAWRRGVGAGGLAEMTSGGPFLKETPRTSPTGFPRGIMARLGKSGWSEPAGSPTASWA